MELEDAVLCFCMWASRLSHSNRGSPSSWSRTRAQTLGARGSVTGLEKLTASVVCSYKCWAAGAVLSTRMGKESSTLLLPSGLPGQPEAEECVHSHVHISSYHQIFWAQECLIVIVYIGCVGSFFFFLLSLIPCFVMYGPWVNNTQWSKKQSVTVRKKLQWPHLNINLHVWHDPTSA